MVLELRDISRTFRRRGAFGLGGETTVALEDVSARIEPGRTLGVIGESGSGKSTLARIALCMLLPDAGRVIFRGEDMTGRGRRALRGFRRAVQPVFQDSAGALDPRMSVARILAEPLVLRGDVPRNEHAGRIAEALRAVGLSPEMTARLPRELSGGQRQRVGIARALIVEPQVMILDEPVSALDVSVQAQVLNLLRDLQEQRGLAYLFIGHDLSVAEFFCDDVLVLHRGRVVERAPSDELFAAPRNDYTRRLIAATSAL